MILPTMNDEEKVFNVARITPMAMEVHNDCIGDMNNSEPLTG